jgi:hypothetical protein
MKKFTLGALAGVTAVIVAVPILAEFTSAQSSSSTSPVPKQRPVPSQACVQALAGSDAAYLANVDTFISAQKSAMQAQESALTAAASVTDSTQRQAAVKKANDDFRAAMKTAMQAQQTAMKTATDAVKSSCGNAAGFGGGFGGFGMGIMGGFGGRGGPGAMMQGQKPDQTAFAAKLGITADQLKTELASGKTIQQIAKEHGVQLPPMMGGRHGGKGQGPWSGGTESSQASSAQ